MANILILYGTSEGYTATIAARIAEMIRANGHDVEVGNGTDSHPRSHRQP